MEDYLRNSRTVRFLNVSTTLFDRVEPSYLFKHEILRGRILKPIALFWFDIIDIIWLIVTNHGILYSLIFYYDNTVMKTVMLNYFKDYLFEARNIIIVIFSSLNYFYSYLYLHTKNVFSTFFQHSFVQYFPPLNLSQKSCSPSFATPPTEVSKFGAPSPSSLFLWLPLLIYNIQVFFHPKFST